MANGSLLLPFQVFSMCRAGTSSLILGGSLEQKGTLAFVQSVSGRLEVGHTLELPSPVMKLGSSYPNSLVALSMLHSSYCSICQLDGTDLKLLGSEATLPSHYEQTFSAFDPGGQALVTAGANNTISLWRVRVQSRFNNTQNGSQEDNGVEENEESLLIHLSTIKIPAKNSMPTINGVCWSPDGQTVVVTGSTVYLYSVERGSTGIPKRLQSFYSVPLKTNANFDYKGCVFADPTTLFVFKRYQDEKRSTIVKYTMAAGKYVSQVKESILVLGTYHTAYDISRDKEHIAFGTATGQIIVINSNTLEVSSRTQAHMYCITGLSFVMKANTDDEVIASCGLDKRLVQTRVNGIIICGKETMNYGLLFLVTIFVLVIIEYLTS
eukprot:TRINITY_DN885_c0_g2_i1.p1 TRINITY_DN885_c0_g2~~TRINITY_DN885_c0_g2_i1.p1  ORF type:complete len:391 (-),score=29.19 TRINITY_DN885_c0_g2_i1:152-1291(-)